MFVCDIRIPANVITNTKFLISRRGIHLLHFRRKTDLRHYTFVGLLAIRIGRIFGTSKVKVWTSHSKKIGQIGTISKNLNFVYNRGVRLQDAIWCIFPNHFHFGGVPERYSLYFGHNKRFSALFSPLGFLLPHNASSG